MRDSYFTYDERLGIHVPDLLLEWDEYTEAQQQMILAEWESIRGNIPDRIQGLEQLINKKQSQLDEEESFNISCTLNYEIAELASQINDLWLWYRTQESTSGKIHA
ncbi:MAG: hypothetical protein ACI35R_10275 [Bacillus sp. (in: firmicutes)]